MTEYTAPAFRFNHVGFTVDPSVLEGESYELVIKFYVEVLGFEVRPKFTTPGKQIVFMAGGVDQFVVLFAHDEPTTANPDMDHFGLAVKSREELDAVFEKAKEFKEQHPDMLVMTEMEHLLMKDVKDHYLRRYYLRCGIPFDLEIQFYDWID